MNYLDKVYLALIRAPMGTRIDITKFKMPNRFLCAVNYLVEQGFIDNFDYGINNDFTIIKKYDHGIKKFRKG